ncbi:thrombospondin-1-like isoform X2 [Dreissena polymorpha]|uniref:thrombospondin-1-like isoform X2 n=1 Tax=Dreissena polymorpha TaxID=45954 RepID=UPI0022651DDA|nr:thrombospondin-1-like isoform X2 [Dreissena polymorpha]
MKAQILYLNIIVACVQTQILGCVGLECFNCSGVQDIGDCNVTTSCGANQMCVGAGGGTGLIGRSIEKQRKARLSDCSECCSTNRCNDNLCQHRAPHECVDDETVDCAKMSSIFNICTGNYEQAALVCPRTCNLCNYANGNWADWSSWSTCTITCGSATQMRTRTCTNPAPTTYGRNCEGQSSDYRSCVKDECPVDGNWGTWSTWGSCSATCGVGIQRRNRYCDNPPPARFGDHCFGDSVDDRICMPRGCSDGGWTTWTNWNSCTVRCGGGNRLRYRECTNPTPSPFGQPCHGPNVDVGSCNTYPCDLVRLTDGRVEIYINGKWGTVCDDSFSTNEARVVCRMLGYLSSNPVVFEHTPAGPSSMPILLDNVRCDGTELSLLDCSHNYIGDHDCHHNEDVGVSC